MCGSMTPPRSTSTRVTLAAGQVFWFSSDLIRMPLNVGCGCQSTAADRYTCVVFIGSALRKDSLAQRFPTGSEGCHGEFDGTSIEPLLWSPAGPRADRYRPSAISVSVPAP